VLSIPAVSPLRAWCVTERAIRHLRWHGADPMWDTRSMSEPSRRLVAIMFTDIAGSTAITGQDEERTVRALRTRRGTP